MIERRLTQFERHVLIGLAIRTRGGSASTREIGIATGLDLSTIGADLVEMIRDKTVTREDNGHLQRQAKGDRFTYNLMEAVNS